MYFWYASITTAPSGTWAWHTAAHEHASVDVCELRPDICPCARLRLARTLPALSLRSATSVKPLASEAKSAEGGGGGWVGG